MKIIALISGGPSNVRPFIGNPYLGRLTSPRCCSPVSDREPWGADNGCFKGFDEKPFRSMLERLPAGGVFVVAPDVLADHRATLALWPKWSQVIRDAGQTPAFVLQDGVDVYPDDATAVFIGGTTAFKYSRIVRQLAARATAEGRWVHMGRVNTRRRVRHARAIGCRSFDGTAASMYPSIKIPLFLRWAETASRQGELF